MGLPNFPKENREKPIAQAPNLKNLNALSFLVGWDNFESTHETQITTILKHTVIIAQLQGGIRFDLRSRQSSGSS